MFNDLIVMLEQAGEGQKAAWLRELEGDKNGKNELRRKEVQAEDKN